MKSIQNLKAQQYLYSTDKRRFPRGPQANQRVGAPRYELEQSNHFEVYRRLLSIYMSIQHRQTSDAKFVEIGGLEIGAVEIKPFHTAAADIDND
ncbi:hypothetical protein CU097_001168 [Rhizopus azygosporus]|uniref:Uncharacterized protein n=1 Tax=Rhizopus azygosporus TaxID=86630 RepID=A0A367KBV8_RHIAZ|nr:hypothetical protein CU097_001168 [Rhizopus azygosporus]